ncbi:MAG TPA: L-serine ammonia-lyase, iron-sulfur-dependent subunit beta [Chthoniobacteraceae bacterium]|nr:L-serine ammonia-lyase, iron-sulfur-dependent subunit beta [Chthoniobacteraceae bacterium]
MNSVFQIIGPPMVGPSSSHTAGAVRIGLLGHRLMGAVPVKARIELHGSFAATGKGHATDRGIVAGLLGWEPDDERLKDSLLLAEAARLQVAFEAVDLGEVAHPNTARLFLTDAAGETLSLTAASVGGGNVEVSELDGFATHLSGTLPSLVLWHLDRPGFLSHLTAILACVEANIATIRTARLHRGAEAITVVELDQAPVPEVTALLNKIQHVRKLRVVPSFG